jgi:acyl carrier protein
LPDSTTGQTRVLTKELLIPEIKDLIINAVGLHHVSPADLSADTSLMQGGLELDSVDILEIVVVMEQQYNIKVASAEMGAQYFRNIGTIADLILLQKSRS